MRTVLLLHCKGDPTSTAERLAKLRHVHWCGSAFGAFDIVMYAVLRDERHLIDFVEQIFGSDANIEDLVICPVLEYFAPESMHSTDAEQASSDTQTPRRGASIDDVDRSLLRTLQVNGRASFAELAEASGISATSAADRFRRLLADGIVKILTLPSPARIGNLVRVTACIRVKGPFRRVLEQAANMHGSLWPCATAGASSSAAAPCCLGSASVSARGAEAPAAPRGSNQPLATGASAGGTAPVGGKRRAYSSKALHFFVASR
jgi:Lrp/AsnC family transcriptional regulator for asnA, asnC and gidA